ncbi:unnamed protein product [Lactuca virosa]|uniref:Uncharacterized protein n=1 Tax=Lactuca virosa TaxID=75947 RepID=A0AAU9MPV2_9ASTR|nr:unnamed protein product [Lactuca virosa]
MPEMILSLTIAIFSSPLPSCLLFLSHAYNLVASSSNTSESVLSLNTVKHLITIQLSLSNYMMCKNQLLPLLTYQNMVGRNDGSFFLPAAIITKDGILKPNLSFETWHVANKRVVILLQASLMEEDFSKIVGLGSTLVSDFGRKFKSIFDQLTAIGQPVDEPDKNHLFLYALGETFETFSNAIRASRYPFNFQVEGHELFLKSLHGSSPPPATFSVVTDRKSMTPNHGHDGRSSRGGCSRGCHPPRYQRFYTNGYYTNACPNLASFANNAPGMDSNI